MPYLLKNVIQTSRERSGDVTKDHAKLSIKISIVTYVPWVILFYLFIKVSFKTFFEFILWLKTQYFGNRKCPLSNVCFFALVLSFPCNAIKTIFGRVLDVERLFENVL